MEQYKWDLVRKRFKKLIDKSYTIEVKENQTIIHGDVSFYFSYLFFIKKRWKSTVYN